MTSPAAALMKPAAAVSMPGIVFQKPPLESSGVAIDLSLGGGGGVEWKIFNELQRVVRGHVRLERRDRNVTVAYGLVVGAVVRLPLVLPFLDPVVIAIARVDAMVDDGDVIALGLHGDAESLGRHLRQVDVE